MSLSTYFYDPFHDPFYSISELSRLFEGIAPTSGRDVQGSDENQGEIARTMRPRMDLHESKDKNEMTVTFELPGLKKEDVNIDVHNNRLIVSGQSAISNELDNEGYALRERRYGRFTRTVPLPTGTKTEDIKASMDNGVLTVKFPRTQPEQEAKRITIS